MTTTHTVSPEDTPVTLGQATHNLELAFDRFFAIEGSPTTARMLLRQSFAKHQAAKARGDEIKVHPA